MSKSAPGIKSDKWRSNFTGKSFGIPRWRTHDGHIPRIRKSVKFNLCMCGDRLWWRARSGENCADNTTSFGNCYCRTDTTHCNMISTIAFTKRPRFRTEICIQPRHIKISISCRLICYSFCRNRALKRFRREPPEDSKLKLVKKGQEFQVGNQGLLRYRAWETIKNPSNLVKGYLLCIIKRMLRRRTFFEPPRNAVGKRSK